MQCLPMTVLLTGRPQLDIIWSFFTRHQWEWALYSNVGPRSQTNIISFPLVAVFFHSVTPHWWRALPDSLILTHSTSGVWKLPIFSQRGQLTGAACFSHQWRTNKNPWTQKMKKKVLLIDLIGVNKFYQRDQNMAWSMAGDTLVELNTTWSPE